MAMKALVAGAEVEYIPEFEREHLAELDEQAAAEYRPRATFFTQRVMSAAERAKLQNLEALDFYPDGSVRKRCYGDAIGYAVGKTLTGWGNVLDRRDGSQRSFVGLKDATGRIIGPAPEDLDALPQEILEELYANAKDISRGVDAELFD